MIRQILDDRRVRYLLAGGGAAAVYYATFTAAWLAVSRSVPYLLITLMANFITAVVMYPIQRRLVFRWDGPWLAGFLRFYVLCLGAAATLFVALPLLVEVMDLHVLFAQAIVIALSPLINYQLSRRWAFRRRPRNSVVSFSGAGSAAIPCPSDSNPELV